MRRVNEEERELIGKVQQRGGLKMGVNENSLVTYKEIQNEEGELDLTLAIISEGESIDSIVSIGYAKRNWKDVPNEVIGRSLAFNRTIRGA